MAGALKGSTFKECLPARSGVPYDNYSERNKR